MAGCYRDTPPAFYKDLTSDGILSYFEDERATEEEIAWIQKVLTSEEYKAHNNPISKWKWGKIKSAFAIKFFPNIAPSYQKPPLTTEERVSYLLDL